MLDTGTRIVMVGGGVMGRTVTAGLLRAGHSAEQVLLCGRDPERAAATAAELGVTNAPTAEAVPGADVVVLAVKPQDMDAALGQVRPALTAGTVVLSLAAGIPLAFLQARLPQGTAVVRAMPNTPSQVGQGMSAISPDPHCTSEQVELARGVLASTGLVTTLPERYQDAVTAISGSGPAYLFFVVESMIESGVHLGLPRSTATELVVQTLFGAATMLKETGEHPTMLREMVSSPGGTTVAAMRELEDHKVRAAFLSAMEAAARRSKDLSDGVVDDD
ncbi:pyrroline-5-carboxylate reductase [Kytococcus aerolatus]|uniref:Pyrroline-5-carboxylate reductase n=1 Tax=Kytococcus aerolatus TaxID=592308 RepID=A0A212TD56_9MICO|nr:pyrroline-5-carboxylate reductase [Kytococcus aerolatus]SNC63953.1 pyrroline-5-carboxylate reductase [Kytococcus aerolatus]